MAIEFPNQSRSYDLKRRCVRFWGYDDACEVSFVIDEAALCQFDQQTLRDEAGLLAAFDSNRERILSAARKVYSPRGGGFYALAISHF